MWTRVPSIWHSVIPPARIRWILWGNCAIRTATSFCCASRWSSPKHLGPSNRNGRPNLPKQRRPSYWLGPRLTCEAIWMCWTNCRWVLLLFFLWSVLIWFICAPEFMLDFIHVCACVAIANLLKYLWYSYLISYVLRACRVTHGWADKWRETNFICRRLGFGNNNWRQIHWDFLSHTGEFRLPCWMFTCSDIQMLPQHLGPPSY